MMPRATTGNQASGRGGAGTALLPYAGPTFWSRVAHAARILLGLECCMCSVPLAANARNARSNRVVLGRSTGSEINSDRPQPLVSGNWAMIIFGSWQTQIPVGAPTAADSAETGISATWKRQVTAGGLQGNSSRLVPKVGGRP